MATTLFTRYSLLAQNVIAPTGAKGTWASTAAGQFTAATAGALSASAGATQTGIIANNSVNGNTAIKQFCSLPLQGTQVLNGTWSIGAAFTMVSGVTAWTGAAALFVMESDGSTIRGTLFNTTQFGTSRATASSELTAFTASITPTTVTAQEGDYLLLELGYHCTTANASDEMWADGTTAITTDNTVTASAKSFITYSGTLNFLPLSTTFYMHLEETYDNDQSLSQTWAGSATWGQTNPNAIINKLSPYIGTTQYSQFLTSSLVAFNYQGIARFASPPLTAQTIAAGTASIGFAASMTAASGGWDDVFGLYLMKGDGTGIRTTLHALAAANSHSLLTEQTCWTSFSISSAVVTDGDYIQVEIGIYSNPAGATNTIYTSGATAITSNAVATTSAASMVTFPTAISYHPDPTTLYLISSLQAPIVNNWTTGTSAGGWTTTTGVTIGQNGASMMDTIPLAEGQNTLSLASASSTTNRLLNQYYSVPLAAAVIPASTWTAGFALSTTGSVAITPKIYIGLINGATGAVRTTITAISTVGAARTSTAEHTVFGTVAGATFTITDGDYIVVEIGYTGATSTAAVLYDSGGTSITTDNTATTDPLAYVSCTSLIPVKQLTPIYLHTQQQSTNQYTEDGFVTDFTFQHGTPTTGSLVYNLLADQFPSTQFPGTGSGTQVSISTGSINYTSGDYVSIAQFTTPRLAAQQIPGGRWGMAYAMQVDNASANVTGNLSVALIDGTSGDLKGWLLPSFNDSSVGYTGGSTSQIGLYNKQFAPWNGGHLSVADGDYLLIGIGALVGTTCTMNMTLFSDGARQVGGEGVVYSNTYAVVWAPCVLQWSSSLYLNATIDGPESNGPTVGILPTGSSFAAWSTVSAFFGGTNGGGMLQFPGTANANTATASGIATTNRGMCQYISQPLAAQTIPIATWTIAFAMSTASAVSTTPKIYIGVASGNNGGIRGVIIPITTIGAARSSTSEHTVFGTLLGGTVSVVAGDYLVVEIGYTAATTMVSNFYDGGNTAITADNAATADAKSFISVNYPLILQPLTTLYLHTNQQQGAFHKQTGFQGSATFTHASADPNALNFYMDPNVTYNTIQSSSSSGNISVASGGYIAIAQFASPPLSVQNIPAAVWQSSWSFSITNGALTGSSEMALYLINGSTGAVRTTLIAAPFPTDGGGYFTTSNQEQSVFNTSFGARLGTLGTSSAGDYLLLVVAMKFTTAGTVGASIYTDGLFAPNGDFSSGITSSQGFLVGTSVLTFANKVLVTSPINTNSSITGSPYYNGNLLYMHLGTNVPLDRYYGIGSALGGWSSTQTSRIGIGSNTLDTNPGSGQVKSLPYIPASLTTGSNTFKQHWESFISPPIVGPATLSAQPWIVAFSYSLSSTTSINSTNPYIFIGLVDGAANTLRSTIVPLTAIGGGFTTTSLVTAFSASVAGNTVSNIYPGDYLIVEIGYIIAVSTTVAGLIVSTYADGTTPITANASFSGDMSLIGPPLNFQFGTVFFLRSSGSTSTKMLTGVPTVASNPTGWGALNTSFTSTNSLSLDTHSYNSLNSITVAMTANISICYAQFLSPPLAAGTILACTATVGVGFAQSSTTFNATYTVVLYLMKGDGTGVRTALGSFTSGTIAVTSTTTTYSIPLSVSSFAITVGDYFMLEVGLDSTTSVSGILYVEGTTAISSTNGVANASPASMLWFSVPIPLITPTTFYLHSAVGAIVGEPQLSADFSARYMDSNNSTAGVSNSLSLGNFHLVTSTIAAYFQSDQLAAQTIYPQTWQSAGVYFASPSGQLTYIILLINGSSGASRGTLLGIALSSSNVQGVSGASTFVSMMTTPLTVTAGDFIAVEVFCGMGSSNSSSFTFTTDGAYNLGSRLDNLWNQNASETVAHSFVQSYQQLQFLPKQTLAISPINTNSSLAGTPFVTSKLYFNDLGHGVTPPSTNYNSWNSVGTFFGTGASVLENNINTINTNAVVSGTITSGQTVGMSQYATYPLQATTISAANWTVLGAFAAKTSTDATAQPKIWIGVIKGDYSGIRGTIYSGNIGAAGFASTNDQTSYSTTISGSSVAIQAGDFIVIEMGLLAGSTSQAWGFVSSGFDSYTSDKTTLSPQSNCQTYVIIPGAIATIPQILYLRANEGFGTSGYWPSTMVLPSSVLSTTPTHVNAAEVGSNANVLDTVSGTGELTISYAATVSTYNVIAQFVSRPLANQIWGHTSQTVLNLSFAGTNSSALSASPYASLFVVNGATGAIRQTILGQTTSLSGNAFEAGTTEESTIYSFAAAVQLHAHDGDYIALEIIAFANSASETIGLQTDGTSPITVSAVPVSNAQSMLSGAANATLQMPFIFQTPVIMVVSTISTTSSLSGIPSDVIVISGGLGLINTNSGMSGVASGAIVMTIPNTTFIAGYDYSTEDSSDLASFVNPYGPYTVLGEQGNANQIFGNIVTVGSTQIVDVINVFLFFEGYAYSTGTDPFSPGGYTTVNIQAAIYSSTDNITFTEVVSSSTVAITGLSGAYFGTNIPIPSTQLVNTSIYVLFINMDTAVPLLVWGATGTSILASENTNTFGTWNSSYFNDGFDMGEGSNLYLQIYAGKLNNFDIAAASSMSGVPTIYATLSAATIKTNSSLSGVPAGTQILTFTKINTNSSLAGVATAFSNIISTAINTNSSVTGTPVATQLLTIGINCQATSSISSIEPADARVLASASIVTTSLVVGTELAAQILAAAKILTASSVSGVPLTTQVLSYTAISSVSSMIGNPTAVQVLIFVSTSTASSLTGIPTDAIVLITSPPLTVSSLAAIEPIDAFVITSAIVNTTSSMTAIEPTDAFVMNTVAIRTTSSLAGTSTDVQVLAFAAISTISSLTGVTSDTQVLASTTISTVSSLAGIASAIQILAINIACQTTSQISSIEPQDATVFNTVAIHTTSGLSGIPTGTQILAVVSISTASSVHNPPTTYYFRNSLSPNSSLVVPSGWLGAGPGEDSGTPGQWFEEYSSYYGHTGHALSLFPGSGQVAITTVPLEINQENEAGIAYYTDPLVAGAIPAGNWTILIGVSNTNVNWTPVAGIYLVNGASGSLRTVIATIQYIGNSFRTLLSEQYAYSATIVGTSATITAGDYLAVEVGWQPDGTTDQLTIYTDGSTQSTSDGTSATNVQAYLQTVASVVSTTTDMQILAITTISTSSSLAGIATDVQVLTPSEIVTNSSMSALPTATQIVAYMTIVTTSSVGVIEPTDASVLSTTAIKTTSSITGTTSDTQLLSIVAIRTTSSVAGSASATQTITASSAILTTSSLAGVTSTIQVLAVFVPVTTFSSMAGLWVATQVLIVNITCQTTSQVTSIEPQDAQVMVATAVLTTSSLAGVTSQQQILAASAIHTISSITGVPVAVQILVSTSITTISSLAGIPTAFAAIVYNAIKTTSSVTGVTSQQQVLNYAAISSASSLSGVETLAFALFYVPINTNSSLAGSTSDIQVLNYTPISTISSLIGIPSNTQILSFAAISTVSSLAGITSQQQIISFVAISTTSSLTAIEPIDAIVMIPSAFITSSSLAGIPSEQQILAFVPISTASSLAGATSDTQILNYNKINSTSSVAGNTTSTQILSYSIITTISSENAAPSVTQVLAIGIVCTTTSSISSIEPSDAKVLIIVAISTVSSVSGNTIDYQVLSTAPINTNSSISGATSDTQILSSTIISTSSSLVGIPINTQILSSTIISTTSSLVGNTTDYQVFTRTAIATTSSVSGITSQQQVVNYTAISTASSIGAIEPTDANVLAISPITTTSSVNGTSTDYQILSTTAINTTSSLSGSVIDSTILNTAAISTTSSLTAIEPIDAIVLTKAIISTTSSLAGSTGSVAQVLAIVAIATTSSLAGVTSDTQVLSYSAINTVSSLVGIPTNTQILAIVAIRSTSNMSGAVTAQQILSINIACQTTSSISSIEPADAEVLIFAAISTVSSVAGVTSQQQIVHTAAINTNSSISGIATGIQMLNTAAIATTSSLSGTTSSFASLINTIISTTSSLAGISSQQQILNYAAISTTSSLAGSLVDAFVFNYVAISTTSSLVGVSSNTQMLSINRILTTSSVAGSTTDNQVLSTTSSINTNSSLSGNASAIQIIIISSPITTASAMVGNPGDYTVFSIVAISTTSSLIGITYDTQLLSAIAISTTSSLAGTPVGYAALSSAPISTTSSVNGATSDTQVLSYIPLSSSSSVAGIASAIQVLAIGIPCTTTSSVSSIEPQDAKILSIVAIATTSSLAGATTDYQVLSYGAISTTSSLSAVAAAIQVLAINVIATSSTLSGSIQDATILISTSIATTSSVAGSTVDYQILSFVTISTTSSLIGSLVDALSLGVTHPIATSSSLSSINTSAIQILTTAPINTNSSVVGSPTVQQVLNISVINTNSSVAGTSIDYQILVSTTISTTSSLSGVETAAQIIVQVAISTISSVGVIEPIDALAMSYSAINTNSSMSGSTLDYQVLTIAPINTNSSLNTVSTIDYQVLTVTNCNTQSSLSGIPGSVQILVESAIATISSLAGVDTAFQTLHIAIINTNSSMAGSIIDAFSFIASAINTNASLAGTTSDTQVLNIVPISTASNLAGGIVNGTVLSFVAISTTSSVTGSTLSYATLICAAIATIPTMAPGNSTDYQVLFVGFAIQTSSQISSIEPQDAAVLATTAISTTSSLAGVTTDYQILSIAAINTNSSVAGATSDTQILAFAAISITSSLSGTIQDATVLAPSSINTASSMSGTSTSMQTLSKVAISTTSGITSIEPADAVVMAQTPISTTSSITSITTVDYQVLSITFAINTNSSLSGIPVAVQILIESAISTASSLSGIPVGTQTLIYSTIATISSLSGVNTSVQIFSYVAINTTSQMNVIEPADAIVLMNNPINTNSSMNGTSFDYQVLIQTNILTTSSLAGSTGSVTQIISEAAIATTSSMTGITTDYQILSVTAINIASSVTGITTDYQILSIVPISTDSFMSGGIINSNGMIATPINTNSSISGVPTVQQVLSETAITTTSNVSGAINDAFVIISTAISTTSSVAGATTDYQVFIATAINTNSSISGSTTDYQVFTYNTVWTASNMSSIEPGDAIVLHTAPIATTSSVTGSPKVMQQFSYATINTSSSIFGTETAVQILAEVAVATISSITGIPVVYEIIIASSSIHTASSLAGAGNNYQTLAAIAINTNSSTSGIASAAQILAQVAINTASNISGSITDALVMIFNSIHTTSNIAGITTDYQILSIVAVQSSSSTSGSTSDTQLLITTNSISTISTLSGNFGSVVPLGASAIITTSNLIGVPKVYENIAASAPISTISSLSGIPFLSLGSPSLTGTSSSTGSIDSQLIGSVHGNSASSATLYTKLPDYEVNGVSGDSVTPDDLIGGEVSGNSSSTANLSKFEYLIGTVYGISSSTGSIEDSASHTVGGISSATGILDAVMNPSMELFGVSYSANILYTKISKNISGTSSSSASINNALDGTINSISSSIAGSNSSNTLTGGNVVGTSSAQSSIDILLSGSVIGISTSSGSITSDRAFPVSICSSTSSSTAHLYNKLRDVLVSGSSGSNGVAENKLSGTVSSISQSYATIYANETFNGICRGNSSSSASIDNLNTNSVSSSTSESFSALSTRIHSTAESISSSSATINNAIVGNVFSASFTTGFFGESTNVGITTISSTSNTNASIDNQISELLVSGISSSTATLIVTYLGATGYIDQDTRSENVVSNDAESIDVVSQNTKNINSVSNNTQTDQAITEDGRIINVISINKG